MASVPRFSLALLHVYFLFSCHASAQTSWMGANASGSALGSDSGSRPSDGTDEDNSLGCRNLTEIPLMLNGKNFSEYCGYQENRQYFFNLFLVTELSLKIAVVNKIIKTGLNSSDCGDHVQDLLCRYIFPLCDNESLPEAPCDMDCMDVLQSCRSEWETLRNLLIFNVSVANGSRVPNFYNPFSFLNGVLPEDCEHLSYYNNFTYSNSCNPLDPVKENLLEETVESGINLDVIIPAVIVPLVVAMTIISFVLWCCCKRWRRRKKERKLRVYPYSSSYDNWRTTLPGWPFVHPRNSRFKSKGELYHQVPESYMEILVDHMDYLIQSSRIHTTTYLAEGRYSEVYQGYVVDLQPHQTQTYRNVVIKRFKEDVRDLDIMDYLEKSLKISDVNHPNVLRLIGLGFDLTGSISLVYPYMVEHDLLTFLKKNRSSDFSCKPSNELCIAKLVDIVMQIGLGMRAITEMGITYKMLSAHTCMCDLGPHVAVGDVSMRQQLGQLRGVLLEEINHRWVAPEGIRENHFTEKSDVWSYGVTCWEVFSLGHHPYEGVRDSELITHIANGNRPERPLLCPPSVFSIMEQCWHYEPQHRPSFTELASSLSEIMGSSKYQREVERIQEMLKENCGRERLVDGVFEHHQQAASHALVSATMSAPQVKATRKDVSHQWSTPGAIVIPGVALTVTPKRNGKKEEHSRSASPAQIVETAFHSDHERHIRWSQLERKSQGSSLEGGSSLEESIYAEVDCQSSNSCEEMGKLSASSEMKECEESGEYENAGLVPNTTKYSLKLPPVQDKVYYNLPQGYLSAIPKSSSVIKTMEQERRKITPSPPSVFKKPKVLPCPSKSKNSDIDTSHAPKSGLDL